MKSSLFSKNKTFFFNLFISFVFEDLRAMVSWSLCFYSVILRRNDGCGFCGFAIPLLNLIFLLLNSAQLRWQPWTLSMGCLQISSIARMHFLYTSHISSGSTLCEFALEYRGLGSGVIAKCNCTVKFIQSPHNFFILLLI